jgi:sRNA-binding protein
LWGHHFISGCISYWWIDWCDGINSSNFNFDYILYFNTFLEHHHQQQQQQQQQQNQQHQQHHHHHANNSNSNKNKNTTTNNNNNNNSNNNNNNKVRLGMVGIALVKTGVAIALDKT